jgi:protein-tyrosine-phosphatase
MAEVIFNSLSSGEHEAFSAGTKLNGNEGQRIGDRPKAGHVIAVLNEIGIDAKNNTRTQITEDMLETADIVVSMAEADTLPDFLKNHSETIYWEVADPFEQSLDFTRNARDQITELIKNLLSRLG